MLKKCLLVLLALSLFLCSCNQGEVGEGTVFYRDALGRDLNLKRHPRRVACLLGSFADVWMSAGGEVVATASDAWDDFSLPLSDDVVNLGGAHSPSLEQLLYSEPDLVLASASTASNVEMRETLETLGIPVVYFDIDNFDDYLEMLKLATDLTGREDLYIKNGLALKEGIDALCEQYRNAPLSEGERKILLLRTSSTSVKVKGSDGTVLGEMLRDMGCINIADQNSTLLENLSMEVILREEPYHIFVVTMGNSTDAAMSSFYRMMDENPAFSSLMAVENGRLHFMDKKLFNLKPNARYLISYETLYQTLTEQ